MDEAISRYELGERLSAALCTLAGGWLVRSPGHILVRLLAADGAWVRPEDVCGPESPLRTRVYLRALCEVGLAEEQGGSDHRFRLLSARVREALTGLIPRR